VKLSYCEDEIANQNPDTPVYKKYFMHGTAHHLGLDVHDVGLYSRVFEKEWYLLANQEFIFLRKELVVV
jgi:Xaa-Pro aminopeptidase